YQLFIEQLADTRQAALTTSRRLGKAFSGLIVTQHSIQTQRVFTPQLIHSRQQFIQAVTVGRRQRPLTQGAGANGPHLTDQVKHLWRGTGKQLDLLAYGTFGVLAQTALTTHQTDEHLGLAVQSLNHGRLVSVRGFRKNALQTVQQVIARLLNGFALTVVKQRRRQTLQARRQAVLQAGNTSVQGLAIGLW